MFSNFAIHLLGPVEYVYQCLDRPQASGLADGSLVATRPDANIERRMLQCSNVKLRILSEAPLIRR